MPTAEEIKAVRYEVGDFDATSQILTDEQITYVLDEEGNDVRGAAARLLESLSRRYALQADVATGDLRLTYSRQSEALAKRAGELRTTQGTVGAPFAGGTSRSDKEARAADSHRTQGAFSRGQFEACR